MIEQVVEGVLIWIWNDGARYLGRIAMISLGMSLVVLMMDMKTKSEYEGDNEL